MDIKVDAQMVEQAVAAAIVNSAIGAKIQVAVNKILSKGWDCPIEAAVQQVIGDVALKMVNTEYQDQIRAAVKAKLDEDTVTAFVERFWSKVMERDR